MNLLVFDIDGTFYPRVKARNIGEFREAVASGNPSPIPGAVATVQRLRLEHPRAACVVLTGRDTRQLPDTTRWVTRNFTMLRQALISMRALETALMDETHDAWAEALKHSFKDKLARLEGLRQKFTGPMTMVDDDDQMRAALRPGDCFIHAPHELDPPRAAFSYRRW